MMAAARPVMVQLLRLQCALWLAVGPIVPYLHQAFSDHLHVYNPQHHRVEDAGPRARVIVVSGSIPLTPTVASGALAKTESLARPACAFSNTITSPASPRTPCAPPSIAFDHAAFLAAFEDHVRPKALLAVAPKHSPPDRSA